MEQENVGLLAVMAREIVASRNWRTAAGTLNVSGAGLLLVVVLSLTACTLPVKNESATAVAAQPAVSQPAAASRVPAATPEDRVLLADMDTYVVGREYERSGWLLTAGPSYHAASGRRCRSVVLRGGKAAGQVRNRVACSETGGWYFAVDVFSGSR